MNTFSSSFDQCAVRTPGRSNAVSIRSLHISQVPYTEKDVVVFLSFERKMPQELKLTNTASKIDLWFHAADVSGSHVLARTNGKVLNKTQLEKIAQLAAFHSKGRSQPIQTVQYTKRKFLSKPKNGAAGAVKLIVLIHQMRKRLFAIKHYTSFINGYAKTCTISKNTEYGRLMILLKVVFCKLTDKLTSLSPCCQTILV